MRELIDFITKHWHLLIALVSGFAYLCAQVRAMRRGIIVMLRADMVRLYNKYHDELGYCPLYVKQALEEEYKQYHALKANGVGTMMYEGLMALPTEPSHKKEE